MDYKEKVTALLNSQELSKEQKEKLEEIFPELKESDDERIRKRLIVLVKGSLAHTDEEINEMIDYLERQAQKPADVEPKFKVGDWVVRNGETLQISGIDTVLDGTFHYWFTKGTWLSSKKMEDAILWTIQDAKDGDVVVDKSDGAIGIFQSTGHHPDGGSYNDPSYCFLHCRYDDGFFYADFEDGNTMDSDDVIPATKEQRDLLFQKMHDAGYEWDVEKKELKKIEQKSVELGKNRSKELSLSLQIQAYLNTASDELYAKGKPLYSEKRIEDIHKCMLMWQKLHNAYFYHNLIEWSEEDESWFKEIELMCLNFSNDIGYRGKFFTWLKSLKDRVQPQSRWKPSVEQLEALNTINVTGCITEIGQGKYLVELYKQLKELKG